jgi:hypothetical protein
LRSRRVIVSGERRVRKNEISKKFLSLEMKKIILDNKSTTPGGNKILLRKNETSGVFSKNNFILRNAMTEECSGACTDSESDDRRIATSIS